MKKKKNTGIIAFLALLSMVMCTPEKEEWPLAMFTVTPNGDRPFYYTGRNVIFDARWSEDYQENGRLTYFWYFNFSDSSQMDTTNSDFPFSQVIFNEPGYYNVNLVIKNEQWENSETMRSIHIVDSNTFYDQNFWDTLYFPLTESYLAFRDSWSSVLAWTRNDLSAAIGDYKISCAGGNSGFQYDWENAMNFRSGAFRVPSREEWELLFNQFGGMDIAGFVFREPSQTFMDLPYAGKVKEDDLCVEAGLKSYYWTADKEGADSAWAVVFTKEEIEARFIKLPVTEALSVKLIFEQPN